jgi:dCMP deaminase
MNNNTATFLNMAWDASQSSNCSRRMVGAVIVRDGVVITAASNGTPEGVTPCNEGGCNRCKSEVLSGGSYDPCLCIHAEQATIAKAARAGHRTDNAILYCTLRPCLACAKLCLEAGIEEIVHRETIQFASDVEESYEALLLSTNLSITRYLGEGVDF